MLWKGHLKTSLSGVCIMWSCCLLHSHFTIVHSYMGTVHWIWCEGGLLWKRFNILQLYRFLFEVGVPAPPTHFQNSPRVKRFLAVFHISHHSSEWKDGSFSQTVCKVTQWSDGQHGQVSAYMCIWSWTFIRYQGRVMLIENTASLWGTTTRWQQSHRIYI